MSADTRRTATVVHASTASRAALAAASLSLYDLVEASGPSNWGGDSFAWKGVGADVMGAESEHLSWFPLASGETVWVVMDTVANMTAVFLASERT